MVPLNRIHPLNDESLNSKGDFVLYWMTAFRRPNSNFALQRAVELANQTGKPLLVFEPLRIGYRWCSDRFHHFVMEGMQDNQKAFVAAGVTYLPYVEPKKGDGAGLLESLSERSVAVVADDYPAFFLPALQRRFASQISTQLEAVDSNGIFPMREAPKVFSRAHFFRIFLQKNLRDSLSAFPEDDPLKMLKSKKKINLDWLKKSWRETRLDSIEKTISKLGIDHDVKPIHQRGGFESAISQADEFIGAKFDAYDEKRNYPEENHTSGLSGYLHFGQISSHQLVESVMKREGWTPDRLAAEPTKKVEGWWGMSVAAEAFLDQLITWRELGFNMAWQDPGYTRYSSLPDWVRKTLDEHRDDPRDPCYSLDQFEKAETDDPLWNAAQNQLVTTGVIHNYLRMLWGKKILHWSSSPEEALAFMVELNNKYAIDGRDPNSYSGIFWVLGRYDRAWGPERPIFGKVRYMASQNTAKKFPVKAFVQQYAQAQR